MNGLVGKPGLHLMAISLAAALAIMYCVVPTNPELFGIGPRAYSMILENIQGSIALVIIVAGLGYWTKDFKVEREPFPVSPIFSFLVFSGGCYWLSNNSWIEVREGVEGTISALFRILWFIIIISLRRSNLNIIERSMYILATIILMTLDQSRTYFLIALLILVSDLGLIAIIPAIASALLVAAIRSNENFGFLHSMMFAIGGEGYLGSQGVFQVLSIGDIGTNFSIPAIQALLAPFTASFVFIAKRLGYAVEYFDSSTYLGSYIKATTGETYPPMGGFFILSEFIRAGYFGMACMALYMTIVFYTTKKLFDTSEYPIGSFIVILSIKNSPMTYWNLVIIVFIAIFVIRSFGFAYRSVASKYLAAKHGIDGSKLDNY